MKTRALVIREIMTPIRVAAILVTAVFLCGCAPKRAEEASSTTSRTIQGEGTGGAAGAFGDAGRVGEIGQVPPVAEMCKPENIGALGIRVAGKPLIPERVLRTNDRADWPVYAPPEIIRVTLPEMLLREIPEGVAPPACPTAEEAKTVPPEDDDGDRSSDGY